MLTQLRKQNKKLIVKYELEKDEKNLQKQKLISNILSHNDCFFKIQIDDALMVLHDLGQSNEEALETYKQLISFENFQKLSKQKNI